MGKATQIEISIAVRHRDAAGNIVGSGTHGTLTYPMAKGEKYAQALERGRLGLPVNFNPQLSSKMVRKRIVERFLDLVDVKMRDGSV